MTLYNAIKAIPGAKPLARLLGYEGKKVFEGSAAYWDRRYRHGGNSGAGSYNRLAAFKAGFVNSFVTANKINSVVEFGAGDGAQLSLAMYPQYIGVDVSETVIKALKARFTEDVTKSFFLVTDYVAEPSDLALSLDVIYHLVEDTVFDTYMNNLFAASTRYVVIYSSNEDKLWPDLHVRHRKFTDWVEAYEAGWQLTEYLPNPFAFDAADQQNTSFADFYVYKKST